MISSKTLNAIEYDKILLAVASKCVLKESKKLILNEKPSTDYEEVKYLLGKTKEAYKILYTHGVTVIEFFDEMLDETERSKRGGTLSMGEILKVCRLLRSSRIAVTTLNSLNDSEITILKDITNCIYYDKYLENEILTKIITDEQIADNATEKLYQIRQNIKRLNEKIFTRKDLLKNYFVYNNKTIFDATSIVLEHNLDILPVIDCKHKYLGVLTIRDILEAYTSYAAVNAQGDILQLTLNCNDLCVSEISRIIENENGHIINLFIEI